MVAFVGAGGKTTAMLALAQEYKALGKGVLVSTTTHIRIPTDTFVDAVLIGKPAQEVGPACTGGSITVLGKQDNAYGKLSGVLVEDLNVIYRNARFDILLVEADGAREKPLKAPGDHEPVIPGDCTHVIGVIGMKAYGQPLNEKWVHRIGHFFSVTGGKPEQMIDESLLLKLIGSPAGLFKNVPVNAERILLLNQCTDELRKNAAALMISSCMSERIGGIALGVRR